MAWDTARTKRLLLEAARAEFSEHGIAGARVDRIAAKAGVNKERIYGYFGNKEKLFNVVLAAAFVELAEKVRPGEGPVGEYVGRIFDFHRDNPALLRLLMFEALHYGDSLVEENPSRHERYTDASKALAESRGCSQEEAGCLLVTLIGLGAWPLAMPQLARLALGAQPQTDEVMDRLREFVIAFAERGAPRGEKPRPGEGSCGTPR
ncbi:TetR/AcrR family transcriptional regulator [Streptomyces maoxianensis]|uniref:TetR/AcrR family transcriptional regulator n=1 Tax=Streptomyces maoxianensis TaxID=1459942 RepID=A0ABV9FWY8_9ACTN